MRPTHCGANVVDSYELVELVPSRLPRHIAGVAVQSESLVRPLLLSIGAREDVPIPRGYRVGWCAIGRPGPCATRIAGRGAVQTAERRRAVIGVKIMVVFARLHAIALVECRAVSRHEHIPQPGN